jgi:hypothetical protein
MAEKCERRSQGEIELLKRFQVFQLHLVPLVVDVIEGDMRERKSFSVLF